MRGFVIRSFHRAGVVSGLKLPRVPGHEVIGRIEEIGPGISRWKIGNAPYRPLLSLIGAPLAAEGQQQATKTYKVGILAFSPAEQSSH
jgi:hypothetical protein